MKRIIPGISPFRLAEQNIRNRFWRSLAATCTFAIIAGTLFAAQYLVGGATQSLESGINRLGADIMVVPAEYSGTSQTVLLTGQPSTFFFRDDSFTRIQGVPGVAKASPEIFIATLYGQSCCVGPVQIIAIDPARDFTIGTWLVENPGVKMGEDDVIVGNSITGEIGSHLLFYGHNFRIVGRLARTGLMGVDMAVFTRFEDARTMAGESGVRAVRKLTIPEGMVSAVLVRVAPGGSPDDVAAEIRNRVPGARTITPAGLFGTVSGQLTAVTGVLYLSTLAVSLISVPLLASIAAMVAHERRRETAILRALGATRSFVIRQTLMESLGLAIMGGLAGIGIAAVILVAFQDFFALSLKVPFSMPSLGTILTAAGTALLLVIVISGIASLYPTFRINQRATFDTLRDGGA